jgi:hypothetical protein
VTDLALAELVPVQAAQGAVDEIKCSRSASDRLRRNSLV